MYLYIDSECLIVVPFWYFAAIHLKEKRMVYTAGPRRTFEQDLEFYPVTRRAWNRALAIRNAEIEELKKQKVEATPTH